MQQRQLERRQQPEAQASLYLNLEKESGKNN